MGSACETDYLIFLITELGYMTVNNAHELTKSITEIKKMLASLIKNIRG
jgi:four helix bundle protein